MTALTAQTGNGSTTWPWDIITRDLLTYPETLALTAALTATAGHRRAAAAQHFEAALTEVLP